MNAARPPLPPQIDDIRLLMNNKHNIRNMSVIAHVDHGAPLPRMRKHHGAAAAHTARAGPCSAPHVADRHAVPLRPTPANPAPSRPPHPAPPRPALQASPP